MAERPSARRVSRARMPSRGPETEEDRWDAERNNSAQRLPPLTSLAYGEAVGGRMSAASGNDDAPYDPVGRAPSPTRRHSATPASGLLRLIGAGSPSPAPRQRTPSPAPPSPTTAAAYAANDASRQRSAAYVTWLERSLPHMRHDGRRTMFTKRLQEIVQAQPELSISQPQVLEQMLETLTRDVHNTLQDERAGRPLSALIGQHASPLRDGSSSPVYGGENQEIVDASLVAEHAEAIKASTRELTRSWRFYKVALALQLLALTAIAGWPDYVYRLKNPVVAFTAVNDLFYGSFYLIYVGPAYILSLLVGTACVTLRSFGFTIFALITTLLITIYHVGVPIVGVAVFMPPSPMDTATIIMFIVYFLAGVTSLLAFIALCIIVHHFRMSRRPLRRPKVEAEGEEHEGEQAASGGDPGNTSVNVAVEEQQQQPGVVERARSATPESPTGARPSSPIRAVSIAGRPSSPPLLSAAPAASDRRIHVGPPPQQPRSRAAAPSRRMLADEEEELEPSRSRSISPAARQEMAPTSGHAPATLDRNLRMARDPDDGDVYSPPAGSRR